MTSTNTSPKKPSPLGVGSPRASPFRRPESPSTLRPSSPSPRKTSNSSLRAGTPTPSPSKTPRPSSAQPAAAPSSPASVTSAIYSPRNIDTPSSKNLAAIPSSAATTPRASQTNTLRPNDPLARLNPALLHSMRESFAVLDRNNDGACTRDDVAEILNQLGLDASSASLTPYFPSANTASINLSTYLTSLSAPLAELSRPDELREAFSAFDTDDSGQIDVSELRDALLNGPLDGQVRMSEREMERIMEGFVSRRAFAKGATGDRGEVFRYHDFMAEVQGAGKVEAEVGV